LLALEHVDKRFGAVHAVRDVSIEFESGCIHALLGENGAGKSTLLRMAAGLLRPDAGVVRFDGAPLAPGGKRAGRGAGGAVATAIVQQQFALVGALTALDNFVLGAEPCDVFGRIDRRAARERAERAAAEIGADVAWDERVDRFSMGERQRLEVVRAVGRDARVLLLDEPTSVLAPGEGASLYALLRRLAASGRAVGVVTHRLDEVRDHADRVTVLRQGQRVATRSLDRGDEAQVRAIAREAMGDDAFSAEPRRAARPVRAGTAPVVDLRAVTLRRELRGLTLSVNAGEVVGVAGVDGNGQEALVRVVAGVERPDGGELRTGRVAAVFADRDREGLVGDASVGDNLVLGELARFSRFGVLARGALAAEALARLDRAAIVPPDAAALARALSGGNRQKVVVERALARADRVDALVLAQPAQGLDAASARRIDAAIARLADQGKAVLVVSADLRELRRLCDRIVVIARGAIVAELPPDAPDARFGEAMLGGTRPPGPRSTSRSRPASSTWGPRDSSRSAVWRRRRSVPPGPRRSRGGSWSRARSSPRRPPAPRGPFRRRCCGRASAPTKSSRRS
jgi:simple sugar transport system ATP-binding protein